MLRELFFSSMSVRAGKMMQEDIAALGPVRLRDVDEAQGAIVALAKSLAEAGEIMLSTGTTEEVIY